MVMVSLSVAVAVAVVILVGQLLYLGLAGILAFPPKYVRKHEWQRYLLRYCDPKEDS